MFITFAVHLRLSIAYLGLSLTQLAICLAIFFHCVSVTDREAERTGNDKYND
jgi:hypothetical protein